LQTYLSRDVRELTQVADEHRFYVFLKAVAARTGQMLNNSSLARDAEISQPTAKNWLSILETSGIVKRLYPYMKNRTKQMISTPKIYMLDTGLAAYLTSWITADTLMNGAAAGHFFETWCFTEILKSYANAGIEPDFTYYRDKDDNEIDLIIQQDGTLYPVEFKKAATVKKDDVKSFSKIAIFRQPTGPGALISLYPDVQLIREGVRTIPAWRL
jgi:predicted AAA+ superfamily ATPase